MSDHYLSVIPQKPHFVPQLERQKAAVQIFRTLLPRAEHVTSEVSENPRFINPVQNLERVSCPYCNTNLDGWWQKALDHAYDNRFSDLSATTPCCRKQTSLNDLRWEFPAGFARFELRAKNANIGGYLEPDQLLQLEQALGCGLRQVLIHI